MPFGDTIAAISSAGGTGAGYKFGMAAEELDIENSGQLLDYLRQRGAIGAGEMPRVTNLAGGVSNRTVLVERADGEAWVMKQALAKLRVAAEWYSDVARIHREAAGMRALNELTPAGTVPALVFEDHEHHLLAMAAVPRPHENWKTMLLAGEVRAEHVRQFAILLAMIHRGGWEQRDRLALAFDDRSFFESLRVEPYYLYSAGQAPASARFIDQLVAETRSKRLTLVHGDYSPKNILIHRGTLVLLDHEVIHFGDPAFDLGFALTHLLSKAHHLPRSRGEFSGTVAEFWKMYRTELGDVPWAAELEGRAVAHTLGCLLARAVGRSPLEYLDIPSRQRQRDAALELMQAPPRTIEELCMRFVQLLAIGH